MNLNSASVLRLLLLLVLHAIADHEERLQHEGVDGVAVGGAGSVSAGAHIKLALVSLVCTTLHYLHSYTVTHWCSAS